MPYMNTVVSYKNFYYNNEKLREEGKKGSVTILKTSYRHEWCTLTTGEVMSLYCLVPFVMEGQFYVTNPSKIRRWRGFRK